MLNYSLSTFSSPISAYSLLIFFHLPFRSSSFTQSLLYSDDESIRSVLMIPLSIRTHGISVTTPLTRNIIAKSVCRYLWRTASIIFSAAKRTLYTYRVPPLVYKYWHGIGWRREATRRFDSCVWYTDWLNEKLQAPIIKYFTCHIVQDNALFTIIITINYTRAISSIMAFNWRRIFVIFCTLFGPAVLATARARNRDNIGALFIVFARKYSRYSCDV